MRKFDAGFFRLKAAMLDLIERAGGQKRAGEIVGLSQQMMSCVARRDHAALLSLQAKHQLERECGAPIVTEIEAEMLGYRLVRETAAPEPAPPSAFAAHAEMTAEFAAVLEGFALRTRDGVFSRADGAASDRELSDLADAVDAFRRFIAAQAAAPS